MNNLLAGGGNGGPNSVNNPILNSSGIFNGLLSTDGGGTTFLSMAIPKIIGLVFVVGAISFFFMLTWGAVGWILSGGDKAHIESSKARITNAFVGFILMIGSYAIIKLIETFFGIDILLIDIGPLIIQ